MAVKKIFKISWYMAKADINAIKREQIVSFTLLDDQRIPIYTEQFNRTTNSDGFADHDLLKYVIQDNGTNVLISRVLNINKPTRLSAVVFYISNVATNSKQKLTEVDIKIDSSQVTYLNFNEVKKVSYDPRDCIIVKQQTHCIPVCTPAVFGSTSPRQKYEVENIYQFPENGGMECPRGDYSLYPYRDDTTTLQCEVNVCTGNSLDTGSEATLESIYDTMTYIGSTQPVRIR